MRPLWKLKPFWPASVLLVYQPRTAPVFAIADGICDPRKHTQARWYACWRHVPGSEVHVSKHGLHAGEAPAVRLLRAPGQMGEDLAAQLGAVWGLEASVGEMVPLNLQVLIHAASQEAPCLYAFYLLLGNLGCKAVLACADIDEE